MNIILIFASASIFLSSSIPMTPTVLKADFTSINNTPVVTAEATPEIDPLFMKVTAYSSSPDETDNTPFITASGKTVRDGVVATNVLPFGTKIKIPSLFGDKIFTVEDRMHRRMKNVMDIWMPSKTDALRFGVAYATIEIVENKEISLR